MGVGLQPLEFTECVADSPAFRDNLQRHEKELERTAQQIKRLVREVKDVVQAAKRLSAAQLALATSMEQFEFACIGASMTEDERVISRSLQHFAHLMRTIEDERERMLGRAHEQILQPLERFRKEHIGAVKEGKKKFDKKTAKFCQSQERTLALTNKKPDAVLQEADAALDMAERDFCAASLEYVFQLQAVQERKKFELVETLLGFVFGWWTFHHTAHDVHQDSEASVRDLQLRIQRTRTNFEETSKQTESLMKKMMEVRQMGREDEGARDGEDAVGGGTGTGAGGGQAGGRAGYLFLMEKKAFGTAWSKHYVSYERANNTLTLTPYNQINVKTAGVSESVLVCGGRVAAECGERRFCWEAVPAERERAPVVLQARSEHDRAAWLRDMDAAPRLALTPAPAPAPRPDGHVECALDDAGFEFVTRLIAAIEARGLDEQGLYRVAGVSSRVRGLVQCASCPRRLPAAAALADPAEWDARTLTSALKAYLRALPDRLLTRRMHDQFIAAAKCEVRIERVCVLRALVLQLPARNRAMLRLVLAHLVRVAARAHLNRMPASNLAVCLGPTLLRAERETVAAILEIKFYNVLVETMLEHYQEIFDEDEPGEPAHAHAHAGQAHDHAAHHNGMHRSSPVPLSLCPALAPAAGAPPLAPGLPHTMLLARADMCVSASGACPPSSARYSPHHHQLLERYAATAAATTTAASAPAPALLLHRHGAASTSSSAESVSGRSASPPAAPAPRPPARAHWGPGAVGAPSPAPSTARLCRVRTLYACLGESEGELSFEPNQIITNVAPSPEPGWLRGTLNGRTGLVPDNYVEPLP